MLMFVLNGDYKDLNCVADVMMVDAVEFALNEKYLWFDVELTINDDTDLSKLDFQFYLIDKNRTIHNQVAVMDSSLYKKENNNVRFFAAFDFLCEYLYTAPLFGFYVSVYNNIGLVQLSY